MLGLGGTQRAECLIVLGITGYRRKGGLPRLGNTGRQIPPPVSCPLERAFRDVHVMTQHIAVQPRVTYSTGRVLFGLETDTPLL